MTSFNLDIYGIKVNIMLICGLMKEILQLIGRRNVR